MAGNMLIVELDQVIARPMPWVRREFSDIRFHQETGLHPEVKFKVLRDDGDKLRFRQEVRVLGMLNRDEYEQTVRADGSILQVIVSGTNAGGRSLFSTQPLGPEHTLLQARLEVPSRGFKRLLRPLIRWRVLRAVRKALHEDVVVLESGRYEAYCAARAALGAGVRSVTV
ncbi:MAG TPA: hypothetical protein VJ385_09875 [Fibrobacteria bacterium]|nr:hypothetical protein [Fibrobacteria bacterium]